ncbi:MAG: DUF4169 family protein [Alphaproteobacteria bacterium]|nr:DUF4169 family protein [Alphaproteobacteria bacterium]MDE2630770.1 DUF4169 family protein [Alphaproteobacteria bacterium]
MAEIVNLRRVRKAKARHAKAVVAQANRAEHGVSKSAHELAKKRAEIEARDVEGRKLDKDR